MISRRSNWQPDNERRTRAHFGLEINSPAVFLHDDGVRHGQALARAFAHRLGGEEWIEDVGPHRFGYAGACIPNPDFGPRPHTACTNPDRPFRFRLAGHSVPNGVCGIDNEIQYYL